MRARYLTYFSYIGTRFRAAEKLWIKNGRNYPDPESVQGIMEIALQKRLRPENYPLFQLSSRTDGGVHALNTTAHVDLERPGTKVFDSNYITYELNKFFASHELSIIVRNTLRVNDDFNARFNAISRTYLYRFAVPKPGIELSETTSIIQHAPIEEWKRCYFIRLNSFDIERFKEGAKYFVGYHDFTTFKKFDKLLQNKQNRRLIYSIDVRPGRPCVTSGTDLKDNILNYWDIVIKGRGFVHNQIRRMVGTLISVANGKLPPEEIKVMLQVPSKHSWHNFIQSIPPHGLYLCDVEYKPEDLVFKEQKTSDKCKESDQMTDEE
ncbi:tRNA pseudouridine synthase-like 1 isoform X1 [Zerene cesonia]|uniref:tRNA pseudouridine synthase-like 1 isoform X1 n=2 Tax=Zerene cesonia TaxID=33412 RepID=UPI0018E5403D|nr:tRNA pseudouridine synthase-like 1 isoform X1 [Zerene cesonia]